jgi:hypothetical protein
MVSRTRPEKKDPKKMQAEAEEAYRKRQDSRRIVSSGTRSAENAYDEITPGTIVHVNDKNQIVLGSGLHNTYKWNERTGDYRSHMGGILNVGTVPEVAEPEGGGGGRGLIAAEPGSVVGAQGGGVLNQGPTTSDVVGGFDQMFAFEPTTAGTHINPLVDPNNWMYQGQGYTPANPGQYVVPNLMTSLLG